jgi:CheY-like chemotaxis protein
MSAMEQPPRVLVVEDDPHVRQLMAAVLAEDGYEVLTAEDGAAGIAVMREQRPDAILLDLMMGPIDGWQFLSLYRDLPGPHPPVIVVTAASQGGQQRADSQGADAVVPKPFSVDRLLDLVATTLARNGSQSYAS